MWKKRSYTDVKTAAYLLIHVGKEVTQSQQQAAATALQTGTVIAVDSKMPKTLTMWTGWPVLFRF